MYYKLQQLFVWILNPIYEKVIYRISKATKNIVVGVCFAMMFLFQIFKRSDFSVWDKMSNTEMALLGCVLLGIVIIMSIDHKLKPIAEYNKFFNLLLACGIIILMISFLHPVGNGFRALSMLMIVGFPCLYCVWGNRGDYNLLFTLVAKGIVIAGAVYFIYCMGFVPFDWLSTVGGRFLGTTNNPNFLRMICIAVICMVLYLLIYSADKMAIIYVVIGGIGFMYLWLSASRTSILAAFAALLAFVLYYVKTRLFNQKDKGTATKKLIVILSVFVAFVIIGASISGHIYEKAITAFDNSNIIQVCLTAQAEETAPTYSNPNSVANRMDGEGKDLNALSSGRISVWKGYINHLNLLGNDGRKQLVIDGYGKLGAHNTCLDIAYRTGIMNGLIFLVFEMITMIYAIGFIIREKCRQPFLFFSSVVIIEFSIYSVLEAATLPFGHPPVLLYYIGIAPLIFVSKKEKG